MKNRGITLITLVITIIILLILAGIGINLSLGENGVFKRAKEAREKYMTAEEKEQQELNELYAYLNESDLPENTKETEAGTKVQMPDKWVTITQKSISTQDGSIAKKMELSSTVYAVSGGEGTTVPVPEGFYYVGGNINTGIVISDRIEDEYDKTGKVKDKDSHEYASKLKGNQFVWIPCTESNYKKIDWGNKNPSITWDMETRVSEKKQIEKYGGFYIGRYEAGVATLDEEKNEFIDSVTFKQGKSLYKNGVSLQSGYNAWGWQNYDYTARQSDSMVTIGSNNAEGQVTIKANSIPYYHADYYTAVEMSRRLYKDKKHVKSELVTGTQWDIMCKYMQEKGVDVTGQSIETSKWGNFTDTSLTNLRGYYAKVGEGTTEAFKEIPKEEGTTSANLKSNYVLLTTGSTEQVKKMNLYDVSGNVCEWTQEAAYLNNLKYTTNDTYNTYVIRGTSFNNSVTSSSACYRGYGYVASTHTTIGFRVVLYLE